MMRVVWGCRSQTRARNSTPVISGMRWSVTTAAIGGPWSRISSAWRALVAVRTSYSSSNVKAIVSRMASSSSTIRMRARAGVLMTAGSRGSLPPGEGALLLLAVDLAPDLLAVVGEPLREALARHGGPGPLLGAGAEPAEL